MPAKIPCTIPLLGNPQTSSAGRWASFGSPETALKPDTAALDIVPCVSGDVGQSATRWTKGWFTDLDISGSLFSSLTQGRVSIVGVSGLLTDNAGLTFNPDVSLQLGLSGQGSPHGLLIGGDAQWYRSAANVMRTPGALTVDGAATLSSYLRVGTATDAAEAGDFSAGLTGANRIFWNRAVSDFGIFGTTSEQIFRIEGPDPTIRLHDTDGSADHKWSRFSWVDGQLHYQALNDAFSAVNTVFRILRSGYTTHNFEFLNGTTVSMDSWLRVKSTLAAAAGDASFGDSATGEWSHIAASKLARQYAGGAIINQWSAIAGTENVLNETGLDINTRVEGNTRPNLLVADAGLDDVFTDGGRRENVIVKTDVNYTLTSADSVVLASTAGASTRTMTLPAPTLGRRYTIIRTDANAKSVTIATTGAETIDGAATLALAVVTASGHGVTLWSDGTNWFTNT